MNRDIRRAALLSFLLAAAACLSAQSSEEELRERILATAAKYRGVPYMYGAESPAAFDCSGFVRYVYREATGLILPRGSKGIYAAGVPIDIKEAKPGDIFVYNTIGGGPSHVAIYLGGGSVIHAVSEGPRTGVIVSKASDSYFPPRLIAARSFLGARASEGAPTARAPAPGAAVPGGNPAWAGAEDTAPAAEIGFSIPRERASYTDRIPAAVGTAISFTLTNDTGGDGTFVVLFYRADPEFSKSEELRRERVSIPTGGSLELPAYLFAEPGVYKLIVKDTWNTQLMERVFTVAAPKR